MRPGTPATIADRRTPAPHFTTPSGSGPTRHGASNRCHGNQDASKTSLLTLKALTYHPPRAESSPPPPRRYLRLDRRTRDWDPAAAGYTDSTYTPASTDVSAGSGSADVGGMVLRAIAATRPSCRDHLHPEQPRPRSRTPLAGRLQEDYFQTRANRVTRPTASSVDVWGEILDGLALASDAGVGAHDAWTCRSR